MSKITEEDIKAAFRDALLHNIDRLYEDFKSRFSNSARRNTIQVPPTLPSPVPNAAAGKRARSTKSGLAKLYTRYLSGEALSSWTRSEQHFVSRAFISGNAWKKAIQLVLALDSMRRRYTEGIRTAPISIGQHGVLDDAVKTLQNYIESLLEKDEYSVPSGVIEQLDSLAINYIDALLVYNKDCYLRDSRWPARFAPTYSGQQLFSLSRDGEKVPPDREKFTDNEPSTSKELQARGERRLRSLGL